jgi:transcriptional antiterminator NusG
MPQPEEAAYCLVMSVTATSLDNWYALAVVAGQESSISKRIIERLRKAGQLTNDMDILCPEEEVVVDAGTPDRRIVRRHTLNGYLLFRCRRLKPAAVSTIMRVNGVMDFLGGASTPTPLPRSEVARILKLSERAGKPSPRTGFVAGDTVTITDGPFSDFSGVILSVNASAQTAQVEVEIFGRKTPATVGLRMLRKS